MNRQPLGVINTNKAPTTTTTTSLKTKTSPNAADLPAAKRVKTETSTTSAPTSSLARKPITTTTSSALSKPTTTSSARPFGATSSSTVRKPTTTTAPTSTVSRVGVSKTSVPARGDDLKNRLEDMEKLVSTLKTELTLNTESVQAMRDLLREREETVNKYQNTTTNLQDSLGESKKELQQAYMEKLDLQTRLHEFQGEFQHKMEMLVAAKDMLEKTLQATNTQLSLSKQECESLKISIQTQISQIASLQGELQMTKTQWQGEVATVKSQWQSEVSTVRQQWQTETTSVRTQWQGEVSSMKAQWTSETTSLSSQLKTSESISHQKSEKISGLETSLEEKIAKIAELEAQIREDETMRKKLHNTIQELKGNIRVFCRVRPLLGKEVDQNDGSEHLTFQPFNDRSIDITATQASAITGKSDTQRKFEFSFDKVFQPGTSQERVFEEISLLVQSALDGYNTCIFAYGQTGSGKTFTMEGNGLVDQENGIQSQEEVQAKLKNRGMIPRAVEQLFASAEKLKEKFWVYDFEVNFLEIYNETLRDLLSKKQADQGYEIKHDPKGNTSVTNLSVVKVRSPSQVYELLVRASANRAVGQTKMNERSSRSHSVFQIKVLGMNTITNEQVKATLSLVDLAGSERVDKSGSTGEAFKEMVNINKSLSSLGDVIASLANKEAHTPYRNSKLTYLLQNSLGGNSKTLMFVNVSPKSDDINETLSSLRFAAKVNACEIGTAKKQTKVDLK